MSVPITNYVDVTISRSTRTVSQVGFGTMLILGPNGAFGANTVREYESLTDVLVDFLSTTDEYEAAEAAFAQTPSPTLVKIGIRETAVAQVQTLVVDADLITGNTITVDVDGVTVSELYAAAHLATMNAFAVSIQAEAGVATAVVGGVGNRTITITAAVAGVPVVLDEEGVSGGLTQAGVVIAVTVANVGVTEDLTAIALSDDDWYALHLTSRTAAEVLQAVAYVETQMKVFITCSSDVNIYDGAATSDIAYITATASRTRSAVIFNETPDDKPDAAWFGRMLPEDPGSNTWMFKELSGITASDLTATRRTAVLTKNANLYVTSSGANFMEAGTVAQGEFLDIIRGIDWITARMQENLMSLLVNAEKVPFTNAGITTVKGIIMATLDDAIDRQLLAADPDSFDGEAYYLYVPDVSDVSDTNKGNRILPDIEWQATLAGAIHKIVIVGRVTL